MREENYFAYGFEPEDLAPQPVHEPQTAVYLGFDNALYTDGKTPCQALPTVLNLKGVKFFMLDSDGNEWPISRKDLIERMEKGEYLWLSSKEDNRKDGSWVQGSCFQIKSTKDIKSYRPEFKPPFSESKIEALLGKPQGSFFFKGRCRQHNQDGTVSRGTNYNTLKRLNAQRLAGLKGDQ